MGKNTHQPRCPYCNAEITIELPENYAPEYRQCHLCSKTFIAERLKQGFQVIKKEGAPCCSDPDCREIEMGSSDEQ